MCECATPLHWLSVPEYEGLYEVNDHGEARSLDRVVTEVTGKKRRHRGRTLKPTILANGYHYIDFNLGGMQQRIAVHRLVLLVFVGPPPPGTEGCHGDGDPSNNHVDNLRWGTRSSNMLDAVRHGRNRNAAKSRCLRGHRLVSPNLHPSALPNRNCYACRLAVDRAGYARKVGRSFDLVAVADRYYHRIMAGDYPCYVPSVP